MAKGYIGINTIIYTPVEYIESTGTQYIDTGYKANINTKIILEAAYSGSATGTNYQQITGGRNSYHASSAIQCAYRTDIELVLVDYGTSGTSNYISVPRLQKFTVQIANQNIKVNDTAYTQLGTFSGTSNYSLWIFDDNSAGSTEKNFTGKIYSYKILENDTIIHNFIPALDTNNTPCLYDLVENTFYYNRGTGTFNYGTVGEPVLADKARTLTKAYVGINNVARKIKKAYIGVNGVARLCFQTYTKLEYIQSTGTQYIDTGLTQNGYHSILDVSISNFTNLQIITGTYGPDDSQRYYTRINTNRSLVTQFGGFSGNNVITGPTLTANTRYIINSKLFNGTQSLNVGNTNYGTRTISGKTFPTANLYLLAIWSTGSAANFCACKLYGAKYYDNSNTLIRDYIPVLDSDNVPCLYDKVEGKFYYNKGTGTFNYGTLSSANSLNSASLINTSLLNNSIDIQPIVSQNETNGISGDMPSGDTI